MAIISIMACVMVAPDGSAPIGSTSCISGCRDDTHPISMFSYY